MQCQDLGAYLLLQHMSLVTCTIPPRYVSDNLADEIYISLPANVQQATMPLSWRHQ